MRKCSRCGGRLRRVHRTLLERLGYMAIYQCQACKQEQVVLRRWRYHFGLGPRCPICGSYRITKLRARDRIDPMRTGFLNLLERLGHGKLFHCRFCRVQFYDRREMQAVDSRAEQQPAESQLETPAPQSGIPEPQSTERA
jgi:DNA-directed RNA polymerase subunit RPC12/RpoP